MRIAIQQILLPGRDLAEQFANAARFGFDGVEIALGPGFDLAQRLDEVDRASMDAGVPVAALCTAEMHDPFVPDVAECRRRFRALTELLLVADELAAEGVVSVPFRPPLSFGKMTHRQITERAIEIYADWAAHLPAGRAKLFLEPLNRYEASFLLRVEHAVEIARAVNHPRVTALADLFHMNIEERNLAEPLRQAGSLLGHVHIADNNRYQPGAGCLDFVAPFRALREISYRGWVSLECWQPEGAVVLGDPAAALPKCVAFLREQWRLAQ